MELFQPWHLLIVAGIAILLFGGKKLPELGKGLGEGLKGFKDGMKGATDEVKGAADAHSVTPQQPAAPVVAKPGDDLKPPTA